MVGELEGNDAASLAVTFTAFSVALSPGGILWPYVDNIIGGILLP